MIKLESRKAIVDKDIRKLNYVVTAGSEEKSALLTQLRKLREDIITTAKRDYVTTQKEVLGTFKTLMEQLASLSFYASEADEDTRNLEKAISQLNKIKTSISENILGLSQEKEDKKDEDDGSEKKQEADEGSDEKVESSANFEQKDEDVEALARDDVKAFIEQSRGTFYEVYESWYTDVMNKGLKISIEGPGSKQIFAVNDADDCFGAYNTEDMEGCLFNTAADYNKAFGEEDDDEDDEDAVEENDD